MIKVIFLDVETTGLDTVKCGIHQLAGTIVMNDEVIDRFDYRINPFKGCEVNEEALAVSNTQALDFLKYNQEWQVIHMFTQLLEKHKSYPKNDKFYLAGWRVTEFDIKFLQSFFERNSLSKEIFDSYFWSNPIDVKTLATIRLMKERSYMKSFRLASVAKYLGVEVEESKLHTAAYDAYLCRKVYEIVNDVHVKDKKILKKRNKNV